MSLAIAYGMKQKARKMARGGMCQHGKADCEMCHGGMYAEGGMAEREDDRMLNQHGADEIGPRGTFDDSAHERDRMIDHPVENQDDVEDMVERIMAQRQEHYADGGEVANKSEPTADFEENEFDDLVKDDHLDDANYTGANSGDEIGNAQEDEDRDDIISRIMRSRRLKDRMPRPA